MPPGQSDPLARETVGSNAPTASNPRAESFRFASRCQQRQSAPSAERYTAHPRIHAQGAEQALYRGAARRHGGIGASFAKPQGGRDIPPLTLAGCEVRPAANCSESPVPSNPRRSISAVRSLRKFRRLTEGGRQRIRAGREGSNTIRRWYAHQLLPSATGAPQQRA